MRRNRLFSPSPRERSECGEGSGWGASIGHPLSTPQTPVGTFCRKVPRPAAIPRAAAHRQHTTRPSFSLPPRSDERAKCGGGSGWGASIGHPLSIPQPPVGTFCRKVPRRAKRAYAAAHRQHTTRRHSPPPGSISGTAAASGTYSMRRAPLPPRAQRVRGRAGRVPSIGHPLSTPPSRYLLPEGTSTRCKTPRRRAPTTHHPPPYSTPRFNFRYRSASTRRPDARHPVNGLHRPNRRRTRPASRTGKTTTRATPSRVAPRHRRSPCGAANNRLLSNDAHHGQCDHEAQPKVGMARLYRSFGLPCPTFD